MDIASYIDHTVLKPDTTQEAVRQVCVEAIDAGFAAVCIPPYYVALASSILQGSNVKVATVIGFPFGYSSTGAKLREIHDALNAGVDELDVVHNIAALKSGDYKYLEQEIAKLHLLTHGAGKTIKVIVESGILTDDELAQCCTIYAPIGIDYMKTSTGYANTGATLHAVQMMRELLPENIHIKASGGIRTFSFAKELIDAGATRIGTSSGIAIVQEAKTDQA